MYIRWPMDFLVLKLFFLLRRRVWLTSDCFCVYSSLHRAISQALVLALGSNPGKCPVFCGVGRLEQTAALEGRRQAGKHLGLMPHS